MIKSLKKILKKRPIYPLFHKIKSEDKKKTTKKIIINKWVKSGKPVPPPHFIKQEVVKEYAKKYSITILIETGTYLGEMISAVKDVFDEIYSIELDINLFANAKKKLTNIKNVHIIQGDSSEALPELLTLIEQPCLFWLDGHYSGCGTAKGDLNTPILKELKSIFSHKIKDHLILIDDARCFTGEEDYPTTKALKEFVTKERPSWVFEAKDDIIRIHRYVPSCIHKSGYKKMIEWYKLRGGNMTVGIQRIFGILRNIRYQLIQLRMRLLQTRLAQTKHNQIIAFNALRDNFSNIYNKLKKYNIVQFTTPLWENYNTKLEKVFLPYPPFSFLRDPTIISTMFVTTDGRWLREELSFLEKKNAKDKLKFFLQEDYVGVPLLLNFTYLTSHNSIHHLYHLIRFLDKTKCNLSQINTIVEWGGGYGNMVKIFRRLKSTPSTYIVIDTPLFSSVQWLYLATILGEESVNLLQNPEDSICAGKINLIPICFVDRHKISADLFISTWALSESSKYSQDYVVTHEWFNAKHILLAYQDSDNKLLDAKRVGEIAADSGAVIEDIEFLPGNHYAFR